MDEQQLKVEPEYRQPLRGALTLICVKCTRYGRFEADHMTRAANKAQEMGWAKFGEEFICPPCSKKYGLCRPKSASISE